MPNSLVKRAVSFSIGKPGTHDLEGKAAPVAYSIAASSSALHWLLLPKLLRNSTCLGWLEQESEEGRLLAQRTLLALANEGGIAEFAGIEGGAGLDHGVEDTRQFVGRAERGRVGRSWPR